MLRGRTALVTGSTGGIGLAVAERLAAAGCSLVLHGLAPSEEGDAVAAGLAAGHAVEACYRQVELAKPDAIAALVAEIGPPDILVNNAATSTFRCH
ncbi:SDR family NAD(P)-dependent oxidoreductase [Dankookia sp. P2]|uniref:SDR family NAD(P)-dependent oxidoreductase n=1 Tax=Dankookia sp. P2 TaxID=3423955 RepID=UPI003D67258D